jgi:hypothetical protein
MAAVPDSERAVIWLDAPDTYDYPAAAANLQLLVTGAEVTALVAALCGVPAVHQKAKAPLRASRFPLLDKSKRPPRRRHAQDRSE